MENKERFLSIYREHIHREGSEKLLDYLLSEHSDFFRAPASLSLIHILYVRGGTLYLPKGTIGRQAYE